MRIKRAAVDAASSACAVNGDVYVYVFVAFFYFRFNVDRTRRELFPVRAEALAVLVHLAACVTRVRGLGFVQRDYIDRV